MSVAYVNSNFNDGKLIVTCSHEFVIRKQVICNSNLMTTHVAHIKQHINSNDDKIQ